MKGLKVVFFFFFMFERIKLIGELKVREIKIEFFEDDVSDVERLKVKFFYEIKCYFLV